MRPSRRDAHTKKPGLGEHRHDRTIHPGKLLKKGAVEQRLSPGYHQGADPEVHRFPEQSEKTLV
jgi:hypothetical protein